MFIFIAPAYNEENNITKLLDNISETMNKMKQQFKVVVVNDGSIDKTAGLVSGYKKTKVMLLNHNTNRGVRDAFRTGFSKACEIAKDDDILVTIEGDNSNDLSIIHEMTKKMEEGHDVVVGDHIKGKVVGAPFHRIMLTSLINFMLRNLFSVGDTKSYTCFFRLYKAKLVKEAFSKYGNNMMQENGFMSMPELLINLHRLGGSVTSIPMTQYYGIDKKGSRMKVVKTINGYLKLMYRLKMKPSVHDKESIKTDKTNHEE